MILIKEENYTKALKVIEQLEKISPKEASTPFAKAYCLCSLNKLEEALKEINKSKDMKSFAVKNLKGQIVSRSIFFSTDNIHKGFQTGGFPILH